MDKRPETQKEWDALLASEGMPAELPVARTRLGRKWRIPGADPQPPRNIPLTNFSDPSRGRPPDREPSAFNDGRKGKEYTVSPRPGQVLSEMEKLMQPGEILEDSNRIDDMIDELSEQFDSDILGVVVNMLMEGYSVREIANELHQETWEIEQYVDAIREKMGSW